MSTEPETTQPTITVQKSTTVTTTTVTANITGAPLTGEDYAKTKFRPDRATATFRNGEFKSLSVTGPSVKKDGTPGVRSGKIVFSAWYASIQSLGGTPMPEWAAPLTIPPTTERPPMPTALVHRMQGVVTDLARFDLDNRRNADELDFIHLEAQSVRRAIEAWYEQHPTEEG